MSKMPQRVGMKATEAVERAGRSGMTEHKYGRTRESRSKIPYNQGIIP